MMEQGRIVKALSGFYYVETAEAALVECKARGKFRKDGKTPTVGDRVEISRSGEHSRARGLAFSGERVWRLAETLARCTVTPTGLSDVVEDWLLN